MTEIGLEPDVIEVGGLLTLSARRTCFDLMRERSLVEAVVVADAFAASDAIRLPEFFAYADAHRRWPGVQHVRYALKLATAYSLSSGETRLRMIVVLGGFPQPWVNVPFWGGDPLQLLGHPDLLLLDVPRPTGLEYDGALHSQPETRRIDLARENRLVTVGGLPILRYENVSVRNGCDRIVVEVADCTGYPTRRLQALDPADFRRPPRSLAW